MHVVKLEFNVNALTVMKPVPDSPDSNSLGGTARLYRNSTSFVNAQIISSFDTCLCQWLEAIGTKTESKVRMTGPILVIIKS